MADFSDIAESLQQDVITEMAESFFGDRVELEDKIGAFRLLTNDLREKMPQVYQSASRLFCLLIDRDGVRNFASELEITFDGLPFVDDQTSFSPESVPFAFTLRKRYEKCLCSAYDRLQKQIDEYNHGRYYTEDGRKRMTIHYLRLKALAEYLNEQTDHVNSKLSPSGVLRYVKKLDTVQAEREKVFGQACLIEGCSLDTELTFSRIDFSALGFPELSDLPPLKDVKKAIGQYCKKECPSRKAEVKNVLKAWRDGTLGH